MTTGNPRIKKPAYFPAQLYYRKSHLLLWMSVSYKVVYPTGHHHHHLPLLLSSFFSSLCCLQTAEITHLVSSRTLICLKNFRLRSPSQLLKQRIPLAVFKSFYSNNVNVPHERITSYYSENCSQEADCSSPIQVQENSTVLSGQGSPTWLCLNSNWLQQLNL